VHAKLLILEKEIDVFVLA